MIALAFTVISCCDRYPKSTYCSGCSKAKVPLPPVCPVSVELVAYPRRSASRSCGYPMAPAHPPVPIALNLPFQPSTGSHTSILILESLVGFTVAATRQNGGRSAYGIAGPRAVAGGVKPPAGTDWASVIVVSGSASDARLSHVAAAIDGDADARTASTNGGSTNGCNFMVHPIRSRTAR